MRVAFVSTLAKVAEKVKRYLPVTGAVKVKVEVLKSAFKSNISGTTGFDTNADTATTLNVAKAGRLNKALKFDGDGNIGVSTFDPDDTATTAGTYRDDALDHRDTAQDYATRTGGVV